MRVSKPQLTEWVCPRCFNLNFSRRELCHKCEAPRSDGELPPPPRDGEQGIVRRATCSFFVRGQCARGELCPYSHAPPPERSRSGAGGGSDDAHVEVALPELSFGQVRKHSEGGAQLRADGQLESVWLAQRLSPKLPKVGLRVVFRCIEKFGKQTVFNGEWHVEAEGGARAKAQQRSQLTTLLRVDGARKLGLVTATVSKGEACLVTLGDMRQPVYYSEDGERPPPVGARVVFTLESVKWKKGTWRVRDGSLGPAPKNARIDLPGWDGTDVSWTKPARVAVAAAAPQIAWDAAAESAESAALVQNAAPYAPSCAPISAPAEDPFETMLRDAPSLASPVTELCCTLALDSATKEALRVAEITDLETLALCDEQDLSGSVGLRPSTAQLLVSACRTATNSDTQGHQLPSWACDPISLECILDPVVAADGFTYERRSIVSWLLSGRRASPLTNEPLASAALVPNRAIREQIRDLLEATARAERDAEERRRQREEEEVERRAIEVELEGARRQQAEELERQAAVQQQLARERAFEQLARDQARRADEQRVAARAAQLRVRGATATIARAWRQRSRRRLAAADAEDSLRNSTELAPCAAEAVAVAARQLMQLAGFRDSGLLDDVEFARLSAKAVAAMSQPPPLLLPAAPAVAEQVSLDADTSLDALLRSRNRRSARGGRARVSVGDAADATDAVFDAADAASPESLGLFVGELALDESCASLLGYLSQSQLETVMRGGRPRRRGRGGSGSAGARNPSAIVASRVRAVLDEGPLEGVVQRFIDVNHLDATAARAVRAAPRSDFEKILYSAPQRFGIP